LFEACWFAKSWFAKSVGGAAASRPPNSELTPVAPNLGSGARNHTRICEARPAGVNTKWSRTAFRQFTAAAA